jgi:hypothetical protein
MSENGTKLTSILNSLSLRFYDACICFCDSTKKGLRYVITYFMRFSTSLIKLYIAFVLDLTLKIAENIADNKLMELNSFRVSISKES